eukprot:gene2652-3438_t
MKLSLRLLFVFLGIFFGSHLKAQPGFVVDYNNNIDSNYSYNTFIPFEGMLTYFGSSTYQGTLQIGIGTFNSGTFIAETLSFSQQVTLQNLESANFFVEIPVSPSFFLEGGGHTVIVWPIMNPDPPSVDIDSTSFFTNINGWLNQAEWKATKQAKLFPVPATDFILLQKPEESAAADITVYGITGSVVYTGKATEATTRIPLDALPAGTYFLRYSDGAKPAEIH